MSIDNATRMIPLEDKSAEKLEQLWFQTYEWFEASLKHQVGITERVNQLTTLMIHLHDQKACIFPTLLSKRHGHFQNINSLYSPYFHLRDFIKDAYNPQLKKVQDADNSSFHYCILKPVIISDFFEIPFTDTVRYSFFEYSHNWRAFSTSSADYWNKRPSILLNTIRRRRTKCSKHGCVFKFFTSITEKVRKDYWHVYHRSWKPTEASQSFIDWLFNFCTNHGFLRLGIAYADSRPIAVQFWIVQHQTAYIFKLAQDIEYDSLSPGTVLMAEMIDWVYQLNNVECIDFLTGSDEYKKLWMDECRPLVGVEIFNTNTLQGKTLWYAHSLKKFIKQLFNRITHHEK